MHKPSMIKMVEEYLGRDYDAEIIAEVAKHMEECPDCKIHIDSVKDTIKLYRITKDDQSIPDDISDRLFKTLKLKRN